MTTILIQHGKVFDGTGRPGFEAGVLIRDGKIARVGNITETSVDEVIDASGHFISPGFVDVTNHSDVTSALFQMPTLDNLIQQGITTIIGGNCGTSLAPLTNPDVIHGIRKWTPTSSINVNWLLVKEYLTAIETLRLSVNFGTLVGHGTLRRGITNDATRPLTLNELAEMKEVLRQALRDGALGFSTNLSAAHEMDASAEELIDIARMVAAEGGIYKTHLRNEGSDLIASVNEVLRINTEAEVSVSVSHLKAIGKRAWHQIPRVIGMLERAMGEGRAVSFDVSPYVSTGSQLYMLLPVWVREGGFSAMLPRLSDPLLFSRISAELSELSLHYDRLVISEAEDGISPGHTIAALAERAGESPESAFLHILRANHGRVSIIGKSLSHSNVRRLIASSAGFIASNGSGIPEPRGAHIPHPRSFGAFPHFLHKYARDRKDIAWEDALKKITSAPAEFFNIKNRGALKEGYAADLVIFNPETLRDLATYEDPFRSPRGIREVMVNGMFVVKKGKVTKERPGQVVKKSK